jgi:hypothetical protein
VNVPQEYLVINSYWAKAPLVSCSGGRYPEKKNQFSRLCPKICNFLFFFSYPSEAIKRLCRLKNLLFKAMEAIEGIKRFCCYITFSFEEIVSL